MIVFNGGERDWLNGLLCRRQVVMLFLAFLLTLQPVLLLMPPAAHAESGGELSGDGTEGNPYIVTNAEQLNEVRNNLSAYYELGNDIDLSGIDNWNPIGGAFDPFIGHFDGKGHTISGLTVRDNISANGGLFAAIGNSGVVQNLVLSVVDISISNLFADVGALAGKLEGKAVNIRVSGGTVAGMNNVGGLVGATSSGAVVEASCANVQVTGGGLSYTGGLVGYLKEASVNVSCSAGEVSEGWYVGGLAGIIEDSQINDSYATGSVSGWSSVGGLIGGIGFSAQSPSTLTHVYAAGKVEGFGLSLGGLIGQKYSEITLTSAYYDKDKTGQSDMEDYSGTPLTHDEMGKETSFAGWDFDTIWHMDDRIGLPTFLRDDNMAPVMSGAKVSDEAPNQVVVHFPEKIDADDAALERFTVSVNGSEARIDGTRLNGQELTLTLAEPVLSGQEVTVTYTDGNPAVTDKAQNRLATQTIRADNEVEPHVAIVSFAPADNATGVAPDGKFVLTFNESIEAMSGKYIYLMDEGGAVVEKIEARSPNVQVKDQVVTITPDAHLQPLKGYYVLIDAGAFRHSADDVHGGISNPAAWNFMTAPDSSAKWVPAGQEGFTEGKASLPALQAGEDGTLYVLFRDEAHGGKATVMKLGGNETQWSLVGSAGFSPGAIGVPSLTVDGDVLYAAFGMVDQDDHASVQVMKYELEGAGDWTPVGDPIAVGDIDPQYLTDQDSTPFLLADNGTVYIAYRDGTVNGAMTVKKLSAGGNWETVGDAGFSAGDIYDPSLAVLDGTLYAGFTDYMFDAGFGATVMKFNTVTGNWELVGSRGFTSGIAFDTSLVSDGKKLYVVYENSAHKASAMTYDFVKGVWETAGSGFSAGQAFGIAAADANGGLYAAYQDVGLGERIAVKKYAASGWVAVGTLGFTTGKAYNPSLIVHNGIPYVVYENSDGKLSAMKYGDFNSPPKALNVRIEGTLRAGQTVKGEYDFQDDENDGQGVSLYRWYTADNKRGDHRKIILGATERTLELTKDHVGKYLVFEVTPVAAQGTLQGSSAASTPAGPVVSPEAPNAPDVTADDELNVIVGADATMEYSTDGGASYTAYDPSNPPTFAGDVTVKVRVAANAVTGATAGADTTLTFTTNPPAPAAPSNLTSAAGDRQVTLNWNAVTGTVSYAVYKYEGATAPADPSGWVLVQANVTATTYTVTGLTNGTTYAFAIKAIHDGSPSDFSNVTTATPRASSSNGGSGGGGEGGSSGGETGIITSTNGAITIPADRAGEVSLDREIIIKVPNGVAEQELRITIEGLNGTSDLLTDQETLVSPVFEVLKNLSGNFKKPVKLSIKFDPTKVGNNQKVAIFYYDEEKKTWIEVGGIVNGEWITAEVDHFTKFAVMAVDMNKDDSGETPKQPNPSFTDIAGHWGENSIIRAAAQKIVSGYPDGTFKPNNPVTRAEFTVMLVGALKLDGTGAAIDFSDLTKIGAWAKRAVALAVQAGIVSGYEDGSFRPDAQITRAEMASMIANALKVPRDANALTGFADNEDIPNWAKGAVEAIHKLGIVSGRGGNKFVPNGTATRAEAVVMLLRMLEVREQE